MSVDETGTVVVRPRGDRGVPVPGAGIFGLAIFIASLCVFFGAGIAAYVVIRGRSVQWPPEGAPTISWGMWVSTGLLLLCSVFIQRALGSIRRGDEVRLRKELLSTLALSLLFVASQLVNWVLFYRNDASFQYSLYGFTFYMLTGLHALHVVGGLVALGWVSYRASHGAYSWAYYPGVRYTAVYWHFLGVVWIVLFGLLLLDG